MSSDDWVIKEATRATGISQFVEKWRQVQLIAKECAAFAKLEVQIRQEAEAEHLHKGIPRKPAGLAMAFLNRDTESEEPVQVPKGILIR